eukprot:235860-Chlamydomonas_euryale.AAC.2
MDEDRLPRQVFDRSLASSVAEDGRVEQRESRRVIGTFKVFLGGAALQSRGIVRQTPVVAPLLRLCEVDRPR